jgi:hypothetical protein
MNVHNYHGLNGMIGVLLNDEIKVRFSILRYEMLLLKATPEDNFFFSIP